MLNFFSCPLAREDRKGDRGAREVIWNTSANPTIMFQLAQRNCGRTKSPTMMLVIAFRAANLKCKCGSVPTFQDRLGQPSLHVGVSEFSLVIDEETFNMRSLIIPTAVLLLFASVSTVVAQERRDGPIARSPRVSADISHPARVSGEFRGPRRFGYRARVYGDYYGYGYRPYRYYTAYGYRPYHRYYRSYGYGPVYGYRGDYCDW